MLKFLRHKKTAKKIWIALAVLVLPAFLFWGFGSVLRNSNEATSAGKIYGRNIPPLEFQDAIAATKNQAIIQYGDKFAEAQKYINLESQAWERLLLLYEAKKHNIKVNDTEVAKFISSYPFFQKNGRFDDRIYAEMLRYVFRTQPRIFEEETRQSLMISKLFDQLTKNLKFTDEEIKQEYRKLSEEVSLYYLAAVPADYAKNIQPTEQEIKDYYAKYSPSFKQPPSFNLLYISVDSEDKIKSVLAKIKQKIDLEKIAKDLGISVTESGLFPQEGPIPGFGWSQQILDMISKLKVGQYSNPIYAEKKYYILKLKDKKDSYAPELAQIKDKVRETIIKERSALLAKGKTQECLAKLKDPAANPKSMDFKKIAPEFGMRSDVTAAFKYGSYIEGIGTSDDFWMATRDLEVGQLSRMIAMPSGFYIVKVKSRVNPDEKKFASDKEKITLSIILAKKQEFFVKYLEDLKKKALQ